MAISILPAAGRARRMGRSKLLLPYRNSTILGSLVDSLQEAGAVPIVLVVAKGDQALLSWGLERGLEVVSNPRPERGMLSSIHEGLKALGGAQSFGRQSEPLLVSPSDLPALTTDTVHRVLAALSPGNSSLVVPTYQNRRGHPIAISPCLVPEIQELDLKVGLRQLLRRHKDHVVEVEVSDPGVLLDVDTPGEYWDLLKRA